ncbi:TPM domain-containing protein [Mycobacterium sp. 663a-19]|uniref:TPM domain-containing protein n=1 Tax=Mycobacterium sp. 663a-19 TaxID=2986148 RepID=UPI002D1F0858|nr:TPM domain-containing protein [Mycobacterium sp. 663a-19]MEB3982597.1 TPM domain-containing protein [Mycobacterium sp. 663a-19]
MRVVRPFGAVLTILTAGFLLAPPAGAQPPSKLTEPITDSAGVLTNPDRAAINTAIERLYRDRHIHLWVAYVDNFSRFKPDNWANQTRSASGMGDQDALLAVATNTKSYTFSAPALAAAESNSLQHNQIEPKVGAKDWSGAAVAAADGLDQSAKPASSSKRTWLPIAIGVAVVVVVIVLILLLYGARRRRRAAQAQTDGQVSIEGRDNSTAQTLSTADARLRQISDYVARHRDSIGGQAQARLEEAKRHLAAAHGKQATNDTEATAHANRASTLAAQAQTLANDDVLAAHRTKRRRGKTT